MIDKFRPYLNDHNLVEEVLASNGKNFYLMPSRRNAGHIAIVLIREITAPTVFRNAEQEVTDIKDLNQIRRIRATPNKFKFGERGRGLLVLRAWNVGGRMPQNRTAVGKSMPIRDAFDLNTLVFGDSAMKGTKVLPVKAAVQYSDALSTLPYSECIGESFHHRGDETGTLWDAEKQKNTDNLFTRHFILPGTLLIQILTSNGCQLPAIGLEHLLLSIGLAGSYGGQTSVTGVNIKTHVVGLFGSRLEIPLSSPYSLLQKLSNTGSVNQITHEVCEEMSRHYRVCANTEEVNDFQQSLIRAFEQDSPTLKSRYVERSAAVADMFEQYFEPKKV
ncbi:MAG: type I-D CRISPR-associated protein Csc2 [Bacteroidetes bacterium]|nr:type I-D CRISPR-associated protein Csc2 [Bacteroidota bacterium]